MKKFEQIISKPINIFVLFLVVGLTLYANALTGPFLYDDYLLIIKNEYTSSFSYIPEMFTSNWYEGVGQTVNLYRPFATFFFLIERTVFDTHTIGYHIVNLLIHVVNTFLVFQIGKSLFKKTIPCLFGALIFLAHPTQVESVSYISGLPDLMNGFFILWASLLFLNLIKKDHPKKNLGIFAFFTTIVVALLTKEHYVVIAGLLPLLYLYSQKEDGKHSRTGLVLAGTTIFLSAGFLALKFTVFNFTDGLGLVLGENFYTMSLKNRMMTFLYYFPEYLRILFYPIDLHFEKEFIAKMVWEPRMETSLLIIGASTLFALVDLFKSRVLLLGIAWFAISLSPFIGIIPANAPYMEHWLYVPIVGLCFIVTYFLCLTEETRYKKIARSALVLILVLCSLRTIERNEQWSNAESFFQHELTYSDYARINKVAAQHYQRVGEPENGLPYIEKAIIQAPNDGGVYLERAELLYMIDPNNESILEDLKKSIELKNSDAELQKFIIRFIREQTTNF